MSKLTRRERDTIHIGCSGWNYHHWRGRFYPKEQKPQEWFSFYTAFFDTVELNNTSTTSPRPRRFRHGMPEPNVPEKAKPTLAQRRAQQRNIEKAQAARWGT